MNAMQVATEVRAGPTRGADLLDVGGRFVHRPLGQNPPDEREGLGCRGSMVASSRCHIQSAFTRWSSITRKAWNSGEREILRGRGTHSVTPYRGAGDNIWVHVELGRIALEDFNDPTLARGHFGYGFELGAKAIPYDFSAILPREHPSNRPLFDAIDGLIACHEALGQPDLAVELRSMEERWISGGGPEGRAVGPL